MAVRIRELVERLDKLEAEVAELRGQLGGKAEPKPKRTTSK